MTPSRRRTRTGIPLAAVLAILTVLFVSRISSRSAEPVPAAPRSAPAAATAPGQVSTGQRTDAPRTDGTTSPAPRGDSPGFASRERLLEHYEKHGAEFPGLGIDAYLRAAQQLRDVPAGGSVLEVRRRDGVVTRFDRESGGFLAVNRDGTIRTFFRPNDGEAYFRRQASRTPGGGP